MQINKKTKTKDINKNGSYYKKGTQILLKENNEVEVIAVATDSFNAKKVLTALNTVMAILNKK